MLLCIRRKGLLEITGFKKLTKVILPAASPSILSGFVNSLRSSFVMLVFAEMYGAGEGMGYFDAKPGGGASTWVGFVFMVIVLVIVMQVFLWILAILVRLKCTEWANTVLMANCPARWANAELVVGIVQRNG